MQLFGTDGIRGIANQDLTADLATKLGFVAGSIICSAGSSVVIGRDTRESGQWLEDALTEGFVNQGVNVLKAGVIPTPAISFLTREKSADLGVVISASHNPSEYNGIKFFNSEGIKLEETLECQIENQLNSGHAHNVQLKPKGSVSQLSGQEIYIKHLKEAADIPLKGMKVLLDCANGAASLVGPQLYSELGIEMQTIACNPNGSNINLECGSTYPEQIKNQIKSRSFDVGFAFDGDADRAIAVDNNGELVDGDFIIAICAKESYESGKLSNNKVVTTVMTNLGFHLAMKELGIEVLLTKVGDKYVLDEMIESNVSLGGEQSGHIIFLDHGPAGDGLLTSLKLLQVMQKTGKPLSELSRVMERLPQVLINVEVKNKHTMKKNDRLSEAIKSAEADLGKKGRILVRPSGTENLIRVMTESDSLSHAQEVAAQVVDIVKEELS